MENMGNKDCRQHLNHYDLQKLRKVAMVCKRCKELVKTRSRVVMGYGDINADIMLIGEAPGRFGADITGVPFTRDKSGRLLQKILGITGFNLDSEECESPRLKNIFITNIVRCNPRHFSGANRTPDKQEILNCHDYLLEEIQIVQPKIIVPLGISASKTIFGDDFRFNKLGKSVRLGNHLILPLWHPAFIVRGGGRAKITRKRYLRYFFRLQKLVSNENMH